MILVAGGTGRLGTRVVTRLAARGLDVRVLSRGTRRSPQVPEGAKEMVVGDVRDAGSVAAAVDGVSLVVSAVQGFSGKGHVTPASVDRDGNKHLVDAATAVGAEFVLMSVVGASSGNPMDLFRAKYEAERYVRERSNAWTIVRATAFIELWAELIAKRIVFGRGDNPINFVSIDDVATVVERVVVDRSFREHVVEIGGPENLTFDQLAALLDEAGGRHSRIRHIPRFVLRAASPLARPARAAIVMDTTDMTFDAARTRAAFPDLSLTEPRAALARLSTAEHGST
jgi:NADH dehydrogenase